jgi:uncharacterized protein YrrD
MPLPDDLRPGADVLSKDGHKLGTLRRVVLKRSDLTLTALVVDIGFLRSGHALWEGGLGLEYDRVVPADQVTDADDRAVRLALTATEFKDAPEYSDERFEAPHDLTPNEFDIPDVANRLHGISGLIGNVPTFWLIERLNRPLDSVDIREGTDVWRLDPHQKLGDVDRVLIDPASGRVNAFVVRRGFILKRDVVLPVRCIAELHDDLIRVDISDQDLENLREYE